MKKIGYYIAVAYLWSISIMPMWVLYIYSDILYYIVYYLIKYRKNVVVSNLQNSFPEKNAGEIKQISKRFYRHLCDLIVEIIAYASISRKSINKRVVYKNIGLIENFYKQGRPVIGVMGHYGNWEWGGNFPMHMAYKSLTTYKPLDDKNFDSLFKRVRERFGFVPLNMKETSREMVKNIRSGEKVILFLIADQTPAYIELHHYATFMGQDTPVFMGPEKMAKAFDAPLVFIKMMKVKRGYYEVEFTTLCEHPRDTQEFELTNLYLRYLEKEIREKPEYWLWSHRRWKHKRTNVESG
ncbi:MAG: lysophospholipid acyltransferase family protein [Prevotellaceae bacterium]|jgi:KDO2-lipid IV(A) lauroyltransferase|nr:lysophospholipid acyltransferase family protein [Prevotellaceae bacterium]